MDSDCDSVGCCVGCDTQCKQGQGDKAKLVAGSARKDGDEARHYLIFALVAGNYAQLDSTITLSLRYCMLLHHSHSLPTGTSLP